MLVGWALFKATQHLYVPRLAGTLVAHQMGRLPSHQHTLQTHQQTGCDTPRSLRVPSTTLRYYPCRRFPLNSYKSLLFHGGDTGSIPVRDANNCYLAEVVSIRNPSLLTTDVNTLDCRPFNLVYGLYRQPSRLLIFNEEFI